MHPSILSPLFIAANHSARFATCWPTKNEQVRKWPTLLANIKCWPTFWTHNRRCWSTFVGCMCAALQVATMVYRCIHGQAQQYLVDCCTPPVNAIFTVPGVIFSPFSVIGSELRPSGILSLYPSDLEFTARLSVGSDTELQLFQEAEDGTFSDN